MSYLGTKAQTGDLSALSINTGTVTTPVWVLIGEINDLAQSGKQAKTDDATNLQSTYEEFIPTLLAPGTFKVTMNRVSADAGQDAMLAAFNSLTVTQFQLQIPKNSSQTTSGDKWVFSALVEEFNDVGNLKADKKITIEASLKVSGVITFTQGS